MHSFLMSIFVQIPKYSFHIQDVFIEQMQSVVSLAVDLTNPFEAESNLNTSPIIYIGEMCIIYNALMII